MDQLAQSVDSKPCVARTDDGKEYVGEIVNGPIPGPDGFYGKIVNDEDRVNVFDGLFSGATWSNAPQNSRYSPEPLVESRIVLPDVVECAIFGRQKQ